MSFTSRLRALSLAALLGIGITACGTDRANSVPNGRAEPGAGGGSRGGSNDGTAAGDTGRTSNPGGKFNNAPTGADKRTEMGKPK